MPKLFSFNMRSATLILFLYFIFFAQLTSFCQSNYLPGYLLTNKSDTLKGFIDQRNWEYNPEEIKFRPTKEGVEQVYSFTDIKEFRTTKEWYISAIFETENSMRMDNLLNSDSSFKIQIDTGFLQVLQRGNKSLLYYRKKGFETNFYIERDGKIELLLYKRHMADSVAVNSTLKYRTTTEVTERKNYTKQLETYLPGCVKVINLLNNAAYTETSFEKIFSTYNKECGTTAPSYTRKADRLKFEFGITAGGQITKISFSASSIGYNAYEALVKANHQPSLNFTGGVFMNLIFQRGLRRLSIYNELGVGSYGSKWSERITNPGSSTYRTYESELAISYFKISNMVQYKLPVNNSSSFFFRAGVLNALNSERKNYQKEESYFGGSGSTPIVSEGKVLPEINKWDAGFAAGLGFELLRFYMEARFEQSKGISDYLSLGSKANKFLLQLGFTF